MTEYTKAKIGKMAAQEAAFLRRETGHPAKVKNWIIKISGNNVSLAVIIQAYDGLRQRNVAI